MCMITAALDGTRGRIFELSPVQLACRTMTVKTHAYVIDSTLDLPHETVEMCVQTL